MPKNIFQLKDFYLKILLSLVCSFSSLQITHADNFLNTDSSPGNKYVKTRLISDMTNLQSNPNQQSSVSTLGILLNIEEGWHTYWRNSGDAGLPIKVKWKLPDGWKVDELLWSTPEKFIEKGNLITYGFKNQTLITAKLFAPENTDIKAEKIIIEADVSWLVCKDICVPGKKHLTLEVPYDNSLPEQPSADFQIFQNYQHSTPITFEEFKNIHPASNISTATLQTGNTYRSVFAIKNAPLKSFDNLNNTIQLFPYFNQKIKFKDPLLHRVDNDLYFSFISAENPQDDILSLVASGIVVFKKELLDLPQDLSVEWEIPLKNNSSAEIEKIITDAEGKELTYRTNLHEEDSTDNPSKPLKQADVTLLYALLSAFIGGLILNLMPCVLPIASIKTMSILEQSNQSRRAITLSALSFVAGILSAFFVISLIVIGLKTFGTTEFGWGFQFQHPEFVFIITIIIFLLGLSFFDLYEISLPFLNKANKAANKVENHYLKNFFDGTLATALSTPCTAPFMGTALVFAFSQGSIYTILLLQVIGIGLSFPYIIVATFPSALKILPRPGNWMYTLRQFFGFLLMGTACWLIFVINRQTIDGGLWTLCYLVYLYFNIWLFKQIKESSYRETTRNIMRFVSLIIFLLITKNIYFNVITSSHSSREAKTELIDWSEYNSELLQKAKDNQQAVFIDFTASWCITCKFNEFRIIETTSTAEAIKKYNILPLKADWTNQDEEITALLKKYGAEGVPLYVILPKNHQKPIVLSTLPSQGALIEAFKTANLN